MADSKISALPASTTPLAGTEVLPIVQSSTTKQVSVANLTAGRDIAATSLTTAAVQATNSGGLTLKNSGGTAQLSVGGGGGDNITLSVATNITPANAAVAISPTGTGTVTINPATASTMNNVAIGGTTALAGRFTTVTATTGANLATTSGSVGIATSSPNQLLTLGSADGTQALSFVTSAYLGDDALIGNIEFSTHGADASYGNLANIKAYKTGTNTNSGDLTFWTKTNGATDIRMRIKNDGVITMSSYGAGAATFSASGVISSVSDETWKTKDGVPVNTDAMLQKLEPGYWFYNEEKAPIYGQDRQLGFYAQNVREAIGEEAAPTPEEGKPWGYYDRSVLAVAVMSLKTALNTIEELKQRIEALENK